MLESINRTLLGFVWLLNYGKWFGKCGCIVQSVMGKAGLRLLKRSRATVGGGGVGWTGLVSSSGRPAVHQNETSS